MKWRATRLDLMQTMAATGSGSQAALWNHRPSSTLSTVRADKPST
ncbi:MAG: hypothetical protein H6R11_2258, partial [Proteobacteria bacterium]|nr:hypothetical protein [Pseudomonadota bacterium]